jgi:hypothetical protein
MKNNIRIAILAASLPALLFFACHKSDTASLTNQDDNGGYASDQATLESHTNSAMTIADNAVNSGGSNLRTTSCAVVTQDSTVVGSVTTHSTTIDFGTGCTGWDGKTRTGMILVNWTGHYKDSGSVRTITSSNYTVNGYSVAIHKSVTNEGMNASGQYWYNVVVGDSIHLTADSVITWSGNRTRTWLAGYSSTNLSDDEYAIGGTTTLTRANGRTFTFSIESGSPLIVADACEYIEAGKVDITGSTITGTRVLNYGDTPNCDNLATVTINGHTYNIVLRK